MSLIHIDLKPDKSALRTFSLVGCGVFTLILVTLHFWSRVVFIPVSAEWAGPLFQVFRGLSIYCAVCGVFVPKLALPLYWLLTLVGAPIGFVASHLVMGIIFYLVITPIALIFKLIGRDSMNRKFDPQASTYWIKRKPPENMKRYFRQF